MSTFFTTNFLRLAIASLFCAAKVYAADPETPPPPTTTTTPTEKPDPVEAPANTPAPAVAPAPVVEKKQLTKEELLAPEFLSKLAQTYGHMVAKSLDNPVIKLNIDDVITGLKEAKEGKEAPLSPKEYEQAMMMLQRHLSEEINKKQIEEADKFLKENVTKEGVIQLDGGKVQYKVLQAGSGDVVVAKDMLPKIKYSISLIDGTSLGSSEHGAIELDVANTLPGLRDGMMGMKVGEKRRIFIHPDLARGISHGGTGLVIFDVEVESIAQKPAKTAENENDEDDLIADDEDDDDDDEEDESLADDEEDLMDEYEVDDEIDNIDDLDSEKIAQIIASMKDDDDDDEGDDDEDDN